MPDIFDPYQNLFSDEPAVNAIRPYRTPQERDSRLKQLAGTVLGGVGYVGSMLDKTFGGRALRGVLGGKPEELLSLIPGSDVMGLTDERNRVSGEDLAKHIGLLEGEGEKGTFEPRDLVGPGLEMALDPAMYLSLGGAALTKGGQIAKKVGIAPKGGAARAATSLGELTTTKDIGRLGEMTAQNAMVENALRKSGTTTAETLSGPLGGHVGVGLPFGENLATFDLSPAFNAASHLPGTGAVKAVGNTLAPLGRSVAAQFQNWRRGAITPEGLALAAEHNTRLGSGMAKLDEAEKALIRKADTLGSAAFDPAGVRAGMEDWGNPATHVLGGLFPQTTTKDFSQLGRATAQNAMGQFPTGQVGPLEGLFGDIRNVGNESYAAAKAAGIIPEGQRLEDVFAQHVARHKGFLPREPGEFMAPGRGPLALPQSVGAMDSRIDPFRNIPGATDTINKLSLDPQYVGLAEKLTPDVLPGAIKTNAEKILQDVFNSAPESADQAKELAAIMANRPGAYLQAGMPYFPHHPIQDTMSSARDLLRATESANTKTQILGQAATSVPVPGATRFDQALRSMGISPEAAAKNLNIPADDLAKLWVPEKWMNEAKRFAEKRWEVPDSFKPVTDVLDTLTNWFRAGNTTVWPGYHFRNKVGNVVQNLATGGYSPSATSGSKAALAGKPIEGAAGLLPELANLSPKEATERLIDLATAHAGLGKGRGLAMESTGGVTQATENLRGLVPGMEPFAGILPTIKSGIPTSGADVKNLANIRGAMGYTQDVSKPIIAGRKIAQSLEDQDLLTHFLAKIEKGYTPEMAGAEAKRALGDYSQLTDFERNVMRRAVPFYSWNRLIAPMVAQEIAQHPGGFFPQAMRASNAFREQAGFVPPQVGQGLAIPLGQEEGGNQKFLSSLGLPHEQILEPLKAGPNAVQRSLEAILAQTNPMFKAPLEYATGKQFFTGRDLDQLYGPTGITALDQAIMNSPLARLYTTARTAVDPRKGVGDEALNLLTGARVTDVDANRWRDIAVKELLGQELSGEGGVKKYSTLYVRPEDVPNLSPRDIALLRLERTLEAEGQKRARQKVGVKK